MNKSRKNARRKRRQRANGMPSDFRTVNLDATTSPWMSSRLARIRFCRALLLLKQARSKLSVDDSTMSR